MRAVIELASFSRQVHGDAAGNDAVHHQAVTEARVGRPQRLFPKQAAFGQHEGEGRIVADGADVAEMVRQPLQFRHQGPQPDGAGGNLRAGGGFDGAGEGPGMGDRAVARDSRRQLGGLGDRAAGHQPFGALVDIAQALLQPDHGFTVAGEAEMPRFDDAGVDGTDGDLVQARPFHRQEGIRLRLA